MWGFASIPTRRAAQQSDVVRLSAQWESDFDDFRIDDDDDEDAQLFSSLMAAQMKKSSRDLSACKVRQFSLGEDIALTDFVGSMGFDEVTGAYRVVKSNADPCELSQSTHKRVHQTGSIFMQKRTAMIGKSCNRIHLIQSNRREQESPVDQLFESFEVNSRVDWGAPCERRGLIDASSSKSFLES